MSFLVRAIVCVVLLAAVPFSFALAQQIPPPAGERLFLTVHTKGDQVYTCKEGVTEFAWVFKAPEAQLLDKDNKPFGKHFTGPSWEASDGSRITGKVVATAPSPDPDSIPWLLLKATAHKGRGVLSRAEYVQRVDTQGGVAPAKADKAQEGKTVRVDYKATYIFFATKK